MTWKSSIKRNLWKNIWQSEEKVEKSYITLPWIMIAKMSHTEHRIIRFDNLIYFPKCCLLNHKQPGWLKPRQRTPFGLVWTIFLYHPWNINKWGAHAKNWVTCFHILVVGPSWTFIFWACLIWPSDSWQNLGFAYLFLQIALNIKPKLLETIFFGLKCKVHMWAIDPQWFSPNCIA